MRERLEMEELLVNLFDPLLTMEEKIEFLKEHPVDYAWCLSDIGGPVLMDGIEVGFKDGSAYCFVIIPGGR